MIMSVILNAAMRLARQHKARCVEWILFVLNKFWLKERSLQWLHQKAWV